MARGITEISDLWRAINKAKKGKASEWSRGPNIEQMHSIAENHEMNRNEKRKFFRAVRLSNIPDWEDAACFGNSQIFFLFSKLSKELSYREGFVTGFDHNIPIRHGWLEWRGKILDISLGTRRKIVESDYHPYFTGSRSRGLEVVIANLKLGCEDCISPEFNPVLTDDERNAITSLCERAYGPKDAEITWGYETALVGEYGRRIGGKRYQKLPSDPLECVMEQYRRLAA